MGDIYISNFVSQDDVHHEYAAEHWIEHNGKKKSASSERRFDRLMSVASLKERLEPITGVPASSMKLTLMGKGNVVVAVLDRDDSLLGAYNPDEFMRLHVEDTNPHRQKNAFTDLSQVQKLEMSEAEYEKRTDSVRAYKQRHKIGRFAETDPEEEQRLANEFEEEASKIKEGDRCLVEAIEGGMAKKGTVRFVGKTEFKPGYWVGVEYDEPLGKHNGTVEGKKYFECGQKRGAFVRPNKVTVGDYPEDDLFDDLDEF